MHRFALLLATVAAACGPDSPSSACKDKLVAGDLVITEVFADFAAPAGGTGEDTGKEWFEIYNNADRPVSLKGMTIVHSRPDGSKPSTHAMDDVTVAPGQYFTLGNATSDLVPPYVDYGYSADLGDFYNTGGGKLALKCGDSEIDSATYDSVKSGHAREFSNSGPPDYTQNDDLANWCEGKDTEFESGNFGTPGEENDCAPIIDGACTDTSGMRPVVTPAIGDLVITEVMSIPTTVSSTVGQWVEVKALTDLDLNGLSIDRASDTSNPTLISSPTCLHMAAGSYAVFARSTDSTMNGGITAIASFPFSINPTTPPADVQILQGTNVIDAVTWTPTSAKSKSLDPMYTNPTANDDPANFCDGVAIYNTATTKMDHGTPGMANETCPMVAPAGKCYEGATLRDIVKPAGNALVINEYLANPAGTVSGVDAAQEWFEITNTGAASFDLNGLTVKAATATTSTIQSSNCVIVPANGFAVLAHNTNPMLNGGLPKVDATFPTTISLGNTTGEINILDGTTVLDRVAWGGTTGAPDGVALQLDPAMRDASSNDAPPTNYFTLTACPNLPMYGGTNSTNKGTPGAANVCTP